MIENDNKDNKYEKVGDKTARSEIVGGQGSQLNVNHDQKREIELANAIDKENIFKNPPAIVKGKPVYLEIKPYILQNPQLQLYGQINNFAVCPFCKYTGTMDIEYEKSAFQKSCCCILAVLGMCLCCWIPYIIRSLSNQVYKCNNCKKILKTIAYNEV